MGTSGRGYEWSGLSRREIEKPGGWMGCNATVMICVLPLGLDGDDLILILFENMNSNLNHHQFTFGFVCFIFCGSLPKLKQLFTAPILNPFFWMTSPCQGSDL